MSDQERLDRLEPTHARIRERREQLRRDIGPVAESAGRSPDLRDAITPEEIVFLLDLADEATSGVNLQLDGIRRRVVLAFNTAGSRGEWDERALLAAAVARDREATK